MLGLSADVHHRCATPETRQVLLSCYGPVNGPRKECMLVHSEWKITRLERVSNLFQGCRHVIQMTLRAFEPCRKPQICSSISSCHRFLPAGQGLGLGLTSVRTQNVGEYKALAVDSVHCIVV